MDDKETSLMPDNVKPRRVLICQNGKCASRSQAEEIYDRLNHLIASYEEQTGEFLPLKVKLVGCLDICENGPNLVIHPDRVWYHNMTPAGIEQIFHRHFLKDELVQELVYRDESNRDPGTPAGCATF
jgi:(2Fe-2S) ferredoxin